MNPIKTAVVTFIRRAQARLALVGQQGAKAAAHGASEVAPTFARDTLVTTLKKTAKPFKRVYSGKQLVSLLEDHGFRKDRVKGSHQIMVKGTTSVPVPVHGNKDLGTGLISAILKQAGLK